MMTAFDNEQETLALNHVVQTQGIFPSGSGGNGSSLTIGTIHTFAFNFEPGGADTDGGLLPINGNEALFSLVGTTFGGDGRTTFGTPDLDGQLAVGNGQGPGLSDHPTGQSFGNDDINLTVAQLPSSVGGGGNSFDNTQASQAITFAINIGGIFPGSTGHGFLGEVNAFATSGNSFSLPSGWVEAEGQLLSIATNSALFSILGTTFGGDGRTTFALPDLRGRTIVGAGDQPGDPSLGAELGTETVTLTQGQLPAPTGSGQSFDNTQPSLTLNYLVALNGVFPSPGSGNGGLSDEVYIGEIVAFAGNFAPAGFAFAHGQLLSIAANSALFSLIGTTYGGDGRTTFALPDLRDRAIVDEGTGRAIGSIAGMNDVTLVAANIPALPPTLDTNTGLTLDEGADGEIGAGQLETNDIDTTDANLTYTLDTTVTNGTLYLDNDGSGTFNAGDTQLNAGDTFTQTDIANGNLHYEHDGSETTADSFQFDVTDGSTPVNNQTFNFTVNAVNDAPTIDTNAGLTLDEGADGEIGAGQLETNDVDTTDANLTYTLDTTVTNGVLYLDNDGSGTFNAGDTQLNAGDTFTQADIANGNLHYEHDGSETTTDSFQFDVTDGTTPVNNQTFTFTVNAVNDAPTVDTNAGLTLDEGADGEIGAGQLETNDADTTDANLTYTLDTTVTNGTLYLDNDGSGTFNAGDTQLNAGDTFTQADIANGNLRYEHDGSETTTDSFQFDATDGTTPVNNQTFTFTVNAINTAPIIGALSANTVDEGAATGTSIGTVAAIDPDGPSQTFTLLDDAGGRFDINATTGELTVETGSLLDFEQSDSHSITVQLSDGIDSVTQGFTININDISPEVIVGSDSDQTLIGDTGDDNISGGDNMDDLFGGREWMFFPARTGTIYSMVSLAMIPCLAGKEMTRFMVTQTTRKMVMTN